MIKHVMVLALFVLMSPGTMASVYRGGVTGGGGNVLVTSQPTRLMDREQVEMRIRTLRPAIVDYLRRKELDFRNGRMDPAAQRAFQPLFINRHQVATMTDAIRLHVDDWHPCFDQNAVAFDGTALTCHADSICLSALRIARKVDAAEIDAQAGALMIHEFSEALGLSDDEAIALQRAALTELKGLSADK